MKKKVAQLIFGAHGDKSGNREYLEELVEDGEITQGLSDKLLDNDALYIGYEVLIYTDVFDDGTFEITSIRHDKQIFVPKS